MKPILILVLTYLLGSIPFGLIAGRLKGVDIRAHGSGNIGATNVGRVLGRRFGIAVFLLDFCKGLLAVTLVAGLAGLADPMRLSWLKMGCLFSAVAGHNWSLFLGFKGGKGVATSAGGLVGILPLSALVGAAVFAGAVWFTGFVSLGSILAALSVPLFLPLLTRPTPPAYWVLSVLLSLLVIWRHRSNIERLRIGTENRVGWARKGSVQ